MSESSRRSQQLRRRCGRASEQQSIKVVRRGGAWVGKRVADVTVVSMMMMDGGEFSKEATFEITQRRKVSAF